MQQSFLAQLGERKVIRVLIAYAVSCFVVIQIIDAIGEPIGLTNSHIRFLLVAMVALLPLVVFLAWALELTPKGLIVDMQGKFGVGFALSSLLTLAIGTASWYLFLKDEQFGTENPATREIRAHQKIAVLPFSNIVVDSAQDYFVDGMTEALIAELAHVRSLRVISRTSIMRYKNSTKSIPEIATELGVSAIVEGSVQKVDGNVSIVAKLIDAISDEPLWAHRYVEPLENVLQLQANVALDITREINVTLTPAERSKLTEAPTINRDALDAYLRGRHFWEQRTLPSFKRALDYFNQAIVLKPDYALAHAAIADAHGLMAIYEYENPRIAYQKARSAATHALALDDSIGEAHSAHGLVLAFLEHDWDDAADFYRRGIELSPNNPNTHLFYALHLIAVGDLDEAEAVIRDAQDLDPLTPLAGSFETELNYYRRQPERAIVIAKRSLELNPDFPATLWQLGEAYLAAQQNEQAASTFERIAILTNRHPKFLTQLGQAYLRLGRTDDAQVVIEEIQHKTEDSAIKAGRLARIYLEQGEHDRAVAALTESLSAAQRQILGLGRGPQWDPLRSHPGFQELLLKLKF